MIYIGIDQSLSFTGVTTISPNETRFYGITHKTHTKWDKLKTRPKNLKIVDYVFEDKTDDNIENERIKYRNIKSLLCEIERIFKEFDGDEVEVRMEGISFGSRQTTAIAELAALNFMIRDLCDKYKFKFTILPPTTVKKFATGNGQADKELMLESFFQLNGDLREYQKVIKLDDIADSFFMATYSE